ncbi:DUF3024 domain-containing protein [Sphingobacterium siyangense]|uniref:DUF3024 domain-containing protein n=2 Tax=Sphingobacterium siyangense TaxID=459529 RepID=UPI0019649F54|nr:DUF3024 domain-containing protein [Sphingobacterium siyangense]QRY57236.1 DUF3024 domain-containing protein [Sphingobacterium siyangense]
MMMDKKELISMIEIQLKSFVDSRRPKDVEVRKKLDFGYSWDGQKAILFEIRPQWNDPSNILELPFAKLRFVKASKIWKLYWMRGSGKWETYEPKPESTNLQLLLDEINHDGYACFFG